jgi:acyl-CoA thioesterase-1
MNIRNQVSESIVMMATEPHRLRFRSLVRDSLRLRSKASSEYPDHVLYSEGIDYIVDNESGTIRRTATSSTPDWSKHPTYGKSDFNHSDYPDCTNKTYTLYADYKYYDPTSATDAAVGSEALSRILAKLANGEAVNYVVFGDSISTGAEVSEEANKFYNRFAETLRKRFPGAVIDVRMKAIGGESSEGGLKRLQDDVIAQAPDLVTIGYGMNDQNKQANGTNATSPSQFERNIATMIEAVQKHTEADIVLITPCLPNPLWKYASPNVTDYADKLRELGFKYRIGIADLQRIWLNELAAGKTHESLLINNVNHPNDYGHSLYAQALNVLLSSN